MNNLTPEQLAFRAGYEQGRFDAQVEREWIGLTDEERAVIVEANTTDDHGYDIWCDGDGVARVVEAKLKEKNK